MTDDAQFGKARQEIEDKGYDQHSLNLGIITLHTNSILPYQAHHTINYRLAGSKVGKITRTYRFNSGI